MAPAFDPIDRIKKYDRRRLGQFTTSTTVPADITSLVSTIGAGVLQGLWDARYRLTTSSWQDAISGYVATYSGGTPSLSGSGTGARAQFSTGTTAQTGSTSATLPTGSAVSIVAVGGLGGASLSLGGGLWSGTDYLINTNGSGDYTAQTYGPSGTVASAVVATGTIAAIVATFSYAGAGQMQVYNQTLVAGTTGTATPAANGRFIVNNGQASTIQAIGYANGILSTAQISAFFTWATTYHAPVTH